MAELFIATTDGLRGGVGTAGVVILKLLINEEYAEVVEAADTPLITAA